MPTKQPRRKTKTCETKPESHQRAKPRSKDREGVSERKTEPVASSTFETGGKKYTTTYYACPPEPTESRHKTGPSNVANSKTRPPPPRAPCPPRPTQSPFQPIVRPPPPRAPSPLKRPLQPSKATTHPVLVRTRPPATQIQRAKAAATTQKTKTSQTGKAKYGTISFDTSGKHKKKRAW